jgi:hypothetical protein
MDLIKKNRINEDNFWSSENRREFAIYIQKPKNQ